MQRVNRILAIPALLTPVAISLLIAVYPLRGSWDDGAITAAYAQTYATTGQISLTPTSTVVEGTSSLLWMLLLTVPAHLSRNPDAVLVWMKCLSALSLIGGLLLVYRFARRQLASDVGALACTLMVAFSYTSLLEVRNGMEMNLCMLLLLLIAEICTGQNAMGTGNVLLACGAMLILFATRFESPFLLAFLILGICMDRFRVHASGWWHDPALLTTASIFSFGVIELWRWHHFGVWMPNTVYAKEWAPYSRWHDHQSVSAILLASVPALIELLPVAGISVLISIIAILYTRTGGRSPLEHPKVSAVVWTLAGATLPLAWITGHDWGYAGRMLIPLLPFLFLAAIALCMSLPRKAARGAIAIMIVAQALVWAAVAPNVRIAFVNIENCRQEALGLDSIRVALGFETLTAMIPDVGGSSLYGKNLRIIDSAMLSNPQLAHGGWASFAANFRQAQPDIFETHRLWASYQHAYDTGLLDDYSIVTSHGFRFFVRNDLYAKLIASNVGAVIKVDASPGCLGGIFGIPADRDFSMSKGTCMTLTGR